MDSDLTLVGTPELLRELHRRFDSLVFVGAAQRTVNEDGIVMSFRGPLYACLGLVEAMKISMVHGEVDDDSTP